MRLDVCNAAVTSYYFLERLVLGRRAGSVSSLSPSRLPSVDTSGIGNPECFQLYMWRLKDGCCPIRYFCKFVDRSPQVKITICHSAGNSTIQKLDPSMAHFECDSADGLTTNTSQTQLDPSVCWIWAMLFSQAAQKEATLICMLWRLQSPGAGFLSCAKRAVL